MQWWLHLRYQHLYLWTSLCCKTSAIVPACVISERTNSYTISFSSQLTLHRTMLFYFKLALLSFLFTSTATQQRPNILFLMADQMRADALSCSGNKAIRTPNLDALAADGVRFANAFSSTPSCTPARAAILTGLSPWYHGMLGYGVIATQYPFELPRAMAKGGYYTCSLGKDHFGWNIKINEGIPHGYDKTDLYDGLPQEVDDYDQWFTKTDPGVDPMATGLEYNDYRGRAYVLQEYYHPTAYVGRAAVNFLESYNSSKPFFLKVSFHRPHSPYDPPKQWMSQYKPENMPNPYVGGNWDSRYAVHYNTTPNPAIWCGDVGLNTVRVSRQAYYGNVGFIDRWVGQIINTLEQIGLTENTFILFTADHGDMLGDHYHFRKTYGYFGSAQIPMIFKWPISMDKSSSDSIHKGSSRGIITKARGSVTYEVVELRDLLPTFLDVGELDTPDSVNGSSLLHLLGSKSETDAVGSSTRLAWREYLDLEHSTCYNITNHWNALTDGHMKYFFRAYFNDEQLFDLDSDPEELFNLAEEGEWQEQLAVWRGRMVAQFEREQRGSAWVQNGTLVRRTAGQTYSPHYPGKPPTDNN